MNKPLLRCAIYTRKSSEEGLEQGFNSLDAQREACEAFVLSQQHEGWKLVPTFYDDGGYSGGNMERPALKQLLADIDQKKINVVVVYKVDRLTRSLADFAKIVEQFDAKGISFVSVTQQFNTTSSMGRLTLNVLLSFAQFEREVTGERIRDKIAASKAKGMWMGGTPPIGYIAKERTLEINEERAKLIRHIHERYLALGSVRLLKQELDNADITTPKRLTGTERSFGGRPFSRGHLYKVLANPVYIGKIVHHDKVFEGQHPAILGMGTWDAVQALMHNNRQGERKRKAAPSDSLLLGLIVDEQGHRLIPSHSQKSSKRYRYYVSEPLIMEDRKSAPDAIRIPAQELETLILNQLNDWLADESAILEILSPKANQIQDISRVIKEYQALLNQNSKERYDFIHRLILKVSVLTEVVEIKINPHALFEDLPHPIEAITISTQAKIERCGMAMRLLVGNKATLQSPNQILINSIGKSQEWLEKLITGKAASVDEIAKQEGTTTNAVTRLIYRAFLAPDIVRAIMDGTQPATLNSDLLKKIVPLPLDWEKQRKLLGFK
ncbi:recombinase family protein [Polynucleobacter sp. AP-Nino-20-G2]|uniref:recombinase family protein n=1 Tax=Polynucleobacter sp. AP-Nino-20-G2 TaxID=2576917 RepID=UPI001BFE0764|nr:recombinase family protein [Polynucleobacter sp. AP-Nino-20-G2]QWE17153.1 recombinase family protein [Polynucleobacter sp. AP-Nino-20-G2]